MAAVLVVFRRYWSRKNSEQDLIDKVLKDIQAADGGSDYDDMGMEFSKKNNILKGNKLNICLERE